MQAQLKDPGAAPPRFSDEEWELRVKLAACYRLIDLYGMTDMIYNHASARVPGPDHHFLINPFGLRYAEITASSLLKVDIDGREIYNPWRSYGINNAGYVIHSAIHRALPAVECIIHTHTPHGMAVSSLECGLLPLTQTAMRFGKVAYHDYEGVVLDLEEQGRLIANLGDAEVMILRNHGLLAVGASVEQAFNNIYRLERSCHTQLLAMSAGSPLVRPKPEVVRRTNQQLSLQPSAGKPGDHKPYGVLEWPGLLRWLDSIDPSYRT
ncbi:class II aldolase/adducin family protein [Pigmentiphaga soli]|uniref:Class II aldolase/adducin family protein n=1 Tax=Pigmentiphaga soli TaxID=1007095 RepID=A0ABP8HQT7_9BURK